MKKFEKNSLNKFINNKDLTQKQKDIIIGTTLGDNHIRQNLSKSLVSLSYGYANKIYSHFLFKNLKSLSKQLSPKENKNLDSRYNKIRYSYTFSLKSLSSLIPFADLFTKLIIKNNKQSYLKIMPSYNTLYKLLTPRALAFLIMDDGHKYKKGGITLCTDSFTLAEVKRLIKVLETKFKFNCTIHNKKNKAKTKIYHRIYIRSSSLSLLHYLIFKYMCTEMLYKI